jgi:type I restriction enzyme S subunit
LRWPTVTLADVATVVSGATPRTTEKRFWGGDILWTTPKDLSDLDTAFLERPPRTITSEGLKSCAASLLPPHSVLLSSRAPIGLVAINSLPMATNQGFKSLVPDSKRLDSRFLYHWLKSKTSYLQSLGNGATFKEISKGVVERIEIPLPPLGEQRRIAAILDKADALRRKRNHVIGLFNNLAQSIFLDIFGDPVLNPKGWNDIESLGNLAEIASGVTKGRKLADGDARDVPYLAVSNVQDKRLDLSNVKQIRATEGEIRRFRIERDDLLLTEGGDPDKLGRGTLWQEEIPEPTIHQNHIFRVRVKSDKVLPIYLIWLISSSYGKVYFLRSAKQTTGIASINKRQLSDFPVLVPPKRLQQEFAEAAHSVKQAINTQASAAQTLDALFSSLQHRAFSGQL